MPGQNSESDHWKRLASELGLELDPEPVEAQPEPPPALPSETPPPDDQFVAVNEWSMETVSATWGAEPAFSDEQPPPLPETEATSAESGEDEEPRRRRRRGRRRKSDKEKVAVPAAEGEAESVEEHDDGGAAEIVRDWDIPSWNDLIASLYRPDR